MAIGYKCIYGSTYSINLITMGMFELHSEGACIIYHFGAADQYHKHIAPWVLALKYALSCFNNDARPLQRSRKDATPLLPDDGPM